MSAQLFDGRKIAQRLTTTVAREVRELAAEKITCGLAAIVVGNDFSAGAHERRVAHIARDLHVPYRCDRLPAGDTRDEVLVEVNLLSQDPI